MLKCSLNPVVSNDGLYWLLPDGSECRDFYCNFKHDSSRIRYKKLKCVENVFAIESDFFNGKFAANAKRGEFLCPTLEQSACTVPIPGVVHPLPVTRESSAGQVAVWQSGTYHTCGRESFLGSVGKISPKFGQEAGDSFLLFNMKKMFYFCDVYLPNKTMKFYKKISNKKMGVFGQCKCQTNGNFVPYPQKTCQIKFAGKFLGKYGEMAQKSRCGKLQIFRNF